jgi:hypothetical protein
MPHLLAFISWHIKLVYYKELHSSNYVSIIGYILRFGSVAWAAERCWFAAGPKLSSSLPRLSLGLTYSKRGFIESSYGLDESGFESRKGKGIFLFSENCRSFLGPTQPHVWWVAGYFLGSRSGRWLKFAAQLHIVLRVRGVNLFFSSAYGSSWTGQELLYVLPTPTVTYSVEVCGR